MALPKREQAAVAAKQLKDSIFSSRTAVAVTLIAAIGSFALAYLNYKLTGESLLLIAQQSAALDARRTAAIEEGQKTAALMAEFDKTRTELLKQSGVLAQAQYQLQQRIADASKMNEGKRTGIEEKRLRAESVRLSADIEKGTNGLVPLIDHSCRISRQQGQFMRLDCNFANKGAHRVTVSAIDIKLADGFKNEITNSVIRFVNDRAPMIPPGRSGAGVYDVYLSNDAWRMQSMTLLLVLKYETDPRAVERFRGSAQEFVSDRDLIDLPRSLQELRLSWMDFASAPKQ